MNTALEILREFVSDVEATYSEAGDIAGEFADEWYDLFLTYQKAKELLRSEEARDDA